jgi:hypothetical protein
MASLIRQAVLIAVLVALGFIGTALGLEAVARGIAPEQQHNRCLLATHHHEDFAANCVSEPMKMTESGWLRYQTNECGYRTAEPCTRREPGQLRVAVLGTSISYGLWVPYPETWAARATTALRSACGRPVDLQNLSFPASHDGPFALWHDIADRAPGAIALQPDAIVTILGPGDLGFYHGGADALSAPIGPPPRKTLKQRLTETRIGFDQAHAVVLFRRWWFSDDARFLDLAMQPRDSSDFLRSPTPPAWRERLGIADDAFAKIAAAAAARRVPWIVLLQPTYGQAVLAVHNDRPGWDPYLFGRELRALVEARGGVFYDLTTDFAAEKRLDRDFYVVNGHPTAEGQVVIARRVNQLLQDAAPAFAACRGAR